jgi:glutathionylspermidine synthase
MQRLAVAPRPNWQQLVEQDGLVWHTTNGQPYWNEGTYYSFTRSEIDSIEAATANVYDLFLRVGEALVSESKTYTWMDRFGIPQYVQQAIRDSWNNEPAALNYGRFDFGFTPGGVPKLFEFNCDTPTSLLEASVIQWKWKEQVFPRHDQFNSLHDKLVGKWRDLRTTLNLDAPIYFANSVEPSGEDTVTVAYLRDTAEQAGFETLPLLIDDIGITEDGNFIDLEGLPIEQVFKLYPWEWMVNEAYGERIIAELPRTTWLEPIWKMMWSNKGILPLLHTFDPGNEYLLPATLGSTTSTNYARKPLLSREGANVTIVRNGQTIGETGGDYGSEGYIYQDLFDLPEFSGKYPVIGSWVVDGEPAGMGIREDGLVTGNMAQFVPHIIEK